MKRPHILINAEAESQLCHVESLREKVRDGLCHRMWSLLHAEAEQDTQRPPYVPESRIEGRSPGQAKHANRDYYICAAAGQRVLRAAVAHLITGAPRFRDSALRQMEVMFDADKWPAWIDKSHVPHGYPADLRTGMLSRDLALAYDWLQPALDATQQQWIVAGIDRCGIQPYLRSVEQEAPWTRAMNNWLTVIVGGLGIAGMALGDDHPQSRQLIDLAELRMAQFLDVIGPDGEFNESVGYVGSMQWSVAYYAAHRYWQRGQANRLAQWPFVESAYWQMYMTLPPGRLAAFGDAGVTANAPVTYVAPIAAAARDPVLQWYFLQYFEPAGGDVSPLLWFDASLPAESPEARAPRGRAFNHYGKVLVSRSSWEPQRASCVVYGKAGREHNHEHHDMGQLCIDAHGQRMIVDLGKPSLYPVDFFRAGHRYRYYNAGVIGHNVLMFGGREMNEIRRIERGRVLASAFDDARGGWWRIDVTEAYDESVQQVRRTVVHLLPGVVAVLDEAQLMEETSISLRWHTIDRCEPDAQGRFLVQGEQGAQLAGRVIALNGRHVRWQRGEHAYAPPYDKDRLGEPLDQPHESYIEATVQGDACQLLSLFAVSAPQATAHAWEADDTTTWRIATAEGVVVVTWSHDALAIERPGDGSGWHVPNG